MKTADFDYYLPKELIAQTPLEPRDHSRLLVLSRTQGTLEHRRFFELGDYLKPGDLLVCNDSRVLPARLFGHWEDSGGKIEVFLLRQTEGELWEVLLKRGRRGRPGARIVLGSQTAEVTGRASDGSFIMRFPQGPPLDLGVIPLPLYIHSTLSDPERYQTVYARPQGSVAAPTAGLHFTPSLMASLREKGIRFAFVTLHVGWGTFRPVRVDDPNEHSLHREYGEIGEEAAREISQARAEGRRIIVVGTTSARLLEEAALAQGLGGEGTRPSSLPPGKDSAEELRPYRGWTSLYILPGHSFRLVDALITNFHLPRSTLLMLVSAFAGRELVLRAYAEAARLGYRFYSFGDGMLIV